MIYLLVSRDPVKFPNVHHCGELGKSSQLHRIPRIYLAWTIFEPRLSHEERRKMSGRSGNAYFFLFVAVPGPVFEGLLSPISCNYLTNRVIHAILYKSISVLF